MKLIIHAGPPKCGSTSIQHALSASAGDLERAGIHYHWNARQNEWSLMYRYSPKNAKDLPEFLKSIFPSRNAALDWSESCWPAFESKLGALTSDCVIISSEHFAHVAQKAAFIDRLRQSFDDIYMVAYARDPLSLYASNVDQAIRGGARLSRLVSPIDYGYDAIKSPRKYENLIDSGNLIIRNFSRGALVGGDVVSDFFQVIADISGRPLAPSRHTDEDNTSLCGAATAWLLTVNEAVRSDTLNRDGRRALMKERLQLIKYLRLDDELAQLPKLSFSGTPVETIVRRNSRAPVEWLNSGYLDEKAALPQVPASSEAVATENALDLLRDLVMGHLTPDAQKLLHAKLFMRDTVVT
jgi:hypothetical protein